MQYALCRLDDGKLTLFEGKSIRVGTDMISNPSAEIVAAQGWKPLVNEEMPYDYDMETQMPEMRYRDDGDYITQYWEIVAYTPPEETPTDAEIIAQLQARIAELEASEAASSGALDEVLTEMEGALQE